MHFIIALDNSYYVAEKRVLSFSSFGVFFYKYCVFNLINHRQCLFIKVTTNGCNVPRVSKQKRNHNYNQVWIVIMKFTMGPLNADGVHYIGNLILGIAATNEEVCRFEIKALVLCV